LSLSRLSCKCVQGLANRELWQNSNSFNLEDRDLLMDYLDRAFTFAQNCMDADREKRRQEDEAQAAYGQSGGLSAGQLSRN